MIINISRVSGNKQGEELFEAEFQDGTKKIFNTWDYVSLYKHAHLYEMIYCDILKCTVYSEICSLLSKKANTAADKLMVLDIACGSGLMGRYLKLNIPAKIELLVGVDILPEAINALNRDTPGIYDKAYVVGESGMKELSEYHFNCMTVCAAANYMEPEDYKQYVGLLSQDAYVVFDLTDDKGNGNKVKILDWMNRNCHLCGNKLYDHRELMDGSVIQHEVFLYRKGY